MPKLSGSPRKGGFHGLWSLGGLERRFGTLRVVRFAIASAIGFLVFEAVVALGSIMLYGSINVPSFAKSSLVIVGLDAAALVLGSTVAFVINERVTVPDSIGMRKKGRLNWFVRWGEYQLATLLGNVVIVLVQISLLAAISLSPVYGSVVGAIVSYPVTYAVAMRFVWRIRSFGGHAPSNVRGETPLGWKHEEGTNSYRNPDSGLPSVADCSHT